MRLCTAFCSLWLMRLALANADEPKIVCYYRNWAVDKIGYERMTISDIDPSLCTHLIYAFVGITEDANVSVVDPRINLPDNGGKAGFQKFNALRKQNARLKTLLSTGDWDGGSAKYSKVAADDSLRSRYVKNVVEFVLRHEFDGFNIYWQWPTIRGGAPYDVQNYVLLVKELRQSFDDHNLILSIHVEGSEEFAKRHYDIFEISKYPHFILVDIQCHSSSDPTTGHNAPLYPAARETSSLDRSRNIKAAVSYWLKEGLPAEKLILGTLFHGLSFILNNSAEYLPGSPASGAARYNLGLGYITYNEICSLTSQDAWTTLWDEEQRVPYSHAGNRWISHDDVRSMTEKGKYVKTMGLGGVMAWSIDMDDHQGECGERNPLLKALNCGIRNEGCRSVPIIGLRMSAEADIVTHTDEDAEKTCAKFDLKYVRHPQNCARFWICQKNRENEFSAEPFSCGDGLYFDTNKIICQDKNLVQCSMD